MHVYNIPIYLFILIVYVISFITIRDIIDSMKHAGSRFSGYLDIVQILFVDIVLALLGFVMWV